MSPHGSDENGLNWDYGIVPYNQLESALSEGVPRYAHLYSYGVSKCRFLSGLLGRPFSIWRNLGALIAANTTRDTVASYLAMVIIISVAQRDTRIPSTSVCCITFKQNVM